MEQTVNGIVIRKTNYRDNSSIITLFTGSLGIIEVSVFGAQSVKSGKCGAVQLFAYIECTLTEKQGRYTLKSANAIEAFQSISSNYERFTAACKLLRAVKQLFSENTNDCDEAFVLLYMTISCMTFSDMNVDDAYIFFLLRAFSLLGICPAITACSVCGESLITQSRITFSADDGGAVCENCARSMSVSNRISNMSLEALRRMLLLDYHDMSKVRLPEQTRRELMRHMGNYYKYYIN